MKLASFEAIVRTLNEASVRYLVVGGLAVNAHGYGRSTFDVDLVIQLIPENIERAFKALAAIDYKPQQPIAATDFSNSETRDGWRRDKGMLVLKFWSDHHRETPLDVFVHEPFDFNHECEQAFHQDFGEGLSVPFVRLETLEAMKREAGRPKDLADLDELALLYGSSSSYDNASSPND